MRAVSANGETRNLSSGGVLFISDARIDAGDTIEYTIHVQPSAQLTQRVALHCLGKVTRARAYANGATQFEIAATLERYEFLRSRN
jgi:hypothetical protein